jgi:hypothetical protein
MTFVGGVELFGTSPSLKPLQPYRPAAETTGRGRLAPYASAELTDCSHEEEHGKRADCTTRAVARRRTV